MPVSQLTAFDDDFQFPQQPSYKIQNLDESTVIWPISGSGVGPNVRDYQIFREIIVLPFNTFGWFETRDFDQYVPVGNYQGYQQNIDDYGGYEYTTLPKLKYVIVFCST